MRRLSPPRRSQRSRPRPRLQVEPLEDPQLLSPILALTDPNQLLRLDSAHASTILATTAVTGLQTDETLRGIDVRPATGELYGLGSTGRLYVIDTNTGAATLKAALAAD